jgi:hypothetical protein
VLRRLRGRVPVPPVLRTDDHTITLGFVPGVPGQDLFDAGRAQEVLRSCGGVLRRIHATPTRLPDADVVQVHGDSPCSPSTPQ